VVLRARHLPAPLAALLLALAAPAAAAVEGPVVKDLRIEGNRRVEVDAIKAVISEKKGAPYDRKKVDQDVRALMKLGFFSDVVVEAQGDPSSPVLVYRVVEKPTVREAKITGNQELSKDDLKDTVEVKAYSILDLAQVKKDVKKIQDKYIEKGYYLAEVTYRLEPLPDNQVDVVYVVDEKAKVEVREIQFIGNAHVPKGDLTAVMQTQEGGLLSAITQSGTYREEAFQRDLQAIQAVYLDRGYVNVKVGKPAIGLSPDRRWLFITIPVEEGEPFNIGKIEVSGQLLGQDQRVRRMLQTRSGEIFSRSRIGQDLFAVGDVFRDMGYAYANVSPLTNVHAKERIIDLSFEVQPGQKVRFEKIEITGNDRTRDKVIRRELRIYEGDLYSASALKVSKNRVQALGFFESVEITTKKGSADDLMVATVEVKERPTGTFQIGAGFSSYENFILTGQISQNNLFGWGQTLSLQVQWSSIRQLGQIQFLDNYFLDTKWTFAFDLYATEGFFTTFNRRAIGGSLTWGYELAGLSPIWNWARNLEDLRLFATYTNEYVAVSQAGTDFVLANRFRNGTTSSVRFALQWDKRDNRLFPSKGWFLNGSAEVAPPFLAPHELFGDKVNLFTRYAADLRAYYPVGLGVVARAKLSLGYIQQWDAAHPIPISELYYVGGINTVRGYRILSIAPTEKVALLPDDRLANVAVGGNKQLVLNTEIEFPLVEKAGIRGVVFFDAGNAFAPGHFDNPGGPLLFKSVGFGFRWFSPIGPLRFEWGIPLDRRRTGLYIDQPVDFQFTIGNFF
jgi:outer membrane protein insertion porin family